MLKVFCDECGKQIRNGDGIIETILNEEGNVKLTIIITAKAMESDSKNGSKVKDVCVQCAFEMYSKFLELRKSIRKGF